jgi:dephospho-CoA kinase
MVAPVFLLSGWSGSGKNAVGTILHEHYGFECMAFADVLKEIVAKEYNFPVRWAHTEIGKQTMLPCGKTVRQILIQRGQEIRSEKNDPGFFAKGIFENIRQTSKPVCITDWRLWAEHEVIDYGCRVDLERPTYMIRIRRKDQNTSPVKDSLTEHQLDTITFDSIIHNPGTTLEELKIEVDRMMSTL